MICYRDMTFCPFYTDCLKAATCGRALTPEVINAATQWWGVNKGPAPIAAFITKPECHTREDDE